MSRPDLRLLAAAALTLLTAGCAVGNVIVGKPSTRPTEPHAALLVSRCSGCHDVPDPGSMTAGEWHDSLERMKRRMRLPQSEWDSLAAMASSH